jgi:PIN domain nuclease of toxin-antitoxin system
VSDGVLLDTHALIWIVEGVALRPAAVEMISAAAVQGELFVSAASAWEMGYLASKPELVQILRRDVRTWFWEAVNTAHARIKDLAPDILLDVALDVAHLPPPLHRDPADRMLIATARAHDLTLITRDRAILDYAAAGHVRAIAC